MTTFKPLPRNFYMSKYELKRFCENYNLFLLLKPEEQIHITEQLTDIIDSYNSGINYGGGFLTAIMTENWYRAEYKADLTNKRCLEIYKDFIHKILPADHEKILKEF